MHLILQTPKHYQSYQTNPFKVGRFGDPRGLCSALSPTQKSLILLNEQSFHYFSYTINITAPKPFTVKECNAILSQKLASIKTELGRSTIIAHYTIQQCYHNTTACKHVLGKQGELSFVLHIYVLKYQYYLEWKQYTDLKYYTFVPKHLGCIKLLSRTMGPSRNMICIHEHTIGCFMVDGGRYSAIDSAPFGLSLLRQAFKDHDISPHLYTDYDRIQSNPLLRKTVLTVFSFFHQHLVDWCRQHELFGKPLLIRSEMTTHPLFLETLQTLSASYHAASTLPLTSSLIGIPKGGFEDILVASRIQEFHDSEINA